MEPDIVIVSQTVSRLAQDFLLEANIALAVNVKSKVIHRLARATNADIVTSPSDVMDANLGSNVSTFYVKTFKGDWGVKPMMIFEGCPPELGCSILLRGADKETLRKVKHVLLVFCIC